MTRASWYFILAAVSCFISAEASRAADVPKAGPDVVRISQGLEGPIGEAFQAQADAFNETHPDIRVQVVQHNGHGGTLTAFSKARAAGDPPEIAVIEAHEVPVASYGNMASIDELIRGDAV